MKTAILFIFANILIFPAISFTQAIVGYSGLFTFDTRDIPNITQLSNLTILPQADTCFQATQTIIASGVVVESGASAKLVAGSNISLLLGTKVNLGGTMHAYIDPSGTYCWLETSFPINLVKINDTSGNGTDTSKPVDISFFSIFPNPTHGEFTVKFLELPINASGYIEIYNVTGTRLYLTPITKSSHLLDLSYYTKGIYILRAVIADKQGIMKVIKY